MRTIRTFERFRRLIRSWVGRTIPLVGIVGRPEIGKTEEYTVLLDGVAHHLFGGRTSALRIYQDVRDAPDLPIVFDDVARLLRDPDALDIMKQIADSKPVRTVRWRTSTLSEQERQFECESTVLVVLNTVPKNDSDVAAILDRFDIVTFAPTKPEIIQRMRTFATDQRDVDIIASCNVMPSLRTLKHFEQWKASELDQIEELYSECGVSDAVATITKIIAEHARPEWIKEYQRLSGKSYEVAKRSWSRHRAEAEQLLRARGISPNGCPIVPRHGNHQKNDGSTPVSADGEDRNERQGTKGQLPGEMDSGWDPNWLESMSRSSPGPSGALDFETSVALFKPDLATENHTTEARVICKPENVAPREEHKGEAEQLLQRRGISPLRCPYVPREQDGDRQSVLLLRGEVEKAGQKGTVGEVLREPTLEVGTDASASNLGCSTDPSPAGPPDSSKVSESDADEMASQAEQAIDWNSLTSDLPKERVRSPQERRLEAERAYERRVQKETEAELAADALEYSVDALAKTFEGDPEGLFMALADLKACNSLDILRVMKNSVRGIDYTNIDSILLMVYVMEEDRYQYACRAKSAIGNIIGHKHMRIVRVRGRKYWQARSSDMFEGIGQREAWIGPRHAQRWFVVASAVSVRRA